MYILQLEVAVQQVTTIKMMVVEVALAAEDMVEHNLRPRSVMMACKVLVLVAALMQVLEYGALNMAWVEVVL
jgi:hypothetical protein